MLLFPGAQNVEGKFFGVICDRDLLRLRENVRYCHQSYRSVLQWFRLVAYYVLQTVQKLQIFDTLHNISTGRKIQYSYQNGQKWHFSLTAARLKPQYLDNALDATIWDELVAKVGRVAHIGKQNWDLLRNEHILARKQIEHANHALNLRLSQNESIIVETPIHSSCVRRFIQSWRIVRSWLLILAHQRRRLIICSCIAAARIDDDIFTGATSVDESGTATATQHNSGPHNSAFLNLLLQPWFPMVHSKEGLYILFIIG